MLFGCVGIAILDFDIGVFLCMFGFRFLSVLISVFDLAGCRDDSLQAIGVQLDDKGYSY